MTKPALKTGSADIRKGNSRFITFLCNQNAFYDIPIKKQLYIKLRNSNRSRNSIM